MGCELRRYEQVLLGCTQGSGSREAEVQTLHVEWNRVELPMEEASRGAIKEAHHWSEIDEAGVVR